MDTLVYSFITGHGFVTDKKTKLLLVEDQILIRDALKQLLNLETDFHVSGDVSNGMEARNFLQEHDVDLVISDIDMPNGDGLELCAWAQEHCPSVKLIILTTFNRAGYVKRAIDAGAKGFILKEVPFEELADNIRSVIKGKKVFDSDLLFAGMQNQNPLTKKECGVLLCAEQGLTTSAIAKKMCLSEGTVRNYLSECMSKLNASSRVEAARMARDNGWL